MLDEEVFSFHIKRASDSAIQKTRVISFHHLGARTEWSLDACCPCILKGLECGADWGLIDAIEFVVHFLLCRQTLKKKNRIQVAAVSGKTQWKKQYEMVEN